MNKRILISFYCILWQQINTEKNHYIIKAHFVVFYNIRWFYYTNDLFVLVHDYYTKEKLKIH